MNILSKIIAFFLGNKELMETIFIVQIIVCFLILVKETKILLKILKGEETCQQKKKPLKRRLKN